ncbi:MAG: hypothetical protein ACFUZC_10465 [Chthoniobacteraceae bacterium]
MKATLTNSWGQPRSRRGVVIVVVLFSLVLITLVIIGHLLRTGTERGFAFRYRASTNTRQVSDTAINLVQAQINHATSQGTSYAWASQPGANLYPRITTKSNCFKVFYRVQSLQNTTAASMETFYRWRIMGSTSFPQ